MYSILFLRQKPNGDWRPIIDLKGLSTKSLSTRPSGWSLLGASRKPWNPVSGHRPHGCLLTHSNLCSLPEIPSLQCDGRNLPVLCTSLWPSDCSWYLHCHHVRDYQCSKAGGNSNPSIPRRLVADPESTSHQVQSLQTILTLEIIV